MHCAVETVASNSHSSYFVFRRCHPISLEFFQFLQAYAEMQFRVGGGGGHVVAQLIEAPCYKPEGHVFDS